MAVTADLSWYQPANGQLRILGFS